MHHVFAMEEISNRDVGRESLARQMMETYEADHFRRVVESGGEDRVRRPTLPCS